MGGKLWVDCIPVSQQTVRTGVIRHVGRRLAGEYREGVQSGHLGEFDFCIPIRALYKTNHHFTTDILGKLTQPFNNVQRAFLIGLYRQTKSIPTGQIRVAEYGFDDIERRFQTICFFGIYR